MLKLFSKYFTVGIFNTALHWVVFGMCLYAFNTNQALANFAAFCIAVTFSFFANARFTFKAKTTTLRYMLYIGFMGTLSAATGWMADQCALLPLFTLIVFSALSLICGFFYSKFIVFRSEKA
ncbi:GtrA family protein [Citrobacter braakii]|uniref:GtrA family protein n=1 Tax=Citrobacter braakii TaxID=57706 RepID=UPI0011EBF90C|nr:GtrA family protein [Citrobacter braakii]